MLASQNTMNENLLKRIDDLKRHIESFDISTEAKNVKEWGGADVIIKSRLDEGIKKWLGGQPIVISFQSTEPRRRAVITKYSKELSWLFYKLKNLFSDQIDYISKYDFYGLLAQTAISYLEDSKEPQDPKDLLLEVLIAAKGFCNDESTR